MNMSKAARIIPILFLAACAIRPEPVIRTVEVKVPVPVACVPPELPGAPTYPDTDEALRAAPGAAERYLMMAAGRELRVVRLRDLETVLSACR